MHGRMLGQVAVECICANSLVAAASGSISLSAPGRVCKIENTSPARRNRAVQQEVPRAT